ncbi:MAG: hypothetical protein WB992_11030 [Bryobacteraceae bacterium]
MILPWTLYGILFATAALAPLRWSIIAYLVLSTIDFDASGSGAIGILNTAKGIILPLYLLWRLSAYAGHQRAIVAPIAWILLATYAGIAAFWSSFPIPALKLAGHMVGSLLICFVLLRATKGGYLTPKVVVPVAVGALVIAILRSVFMPAYGDEPARFTAFSSAQYFAAFLAALYCIALCSKALRPGVRIALCLVIVGALILDGSRIWTIGTAIATVAALLLSDLPPWLKICGAGLAAILISVAVGAGDRVISLIASRSQSNRIASAITAAYEGDVKSRGLGTYNLRRGLNFRELQAIANSSPTELVVGHGTSNGALVVTGSVFKAHIDPNRLMHDEWLRVTYEWGIIGLILWLAFFTSIAVFAYQGFRKDRSGHAKPLLIYLPAFLLGLAGENILAGAGNSVSVGFLLLIALASISHRPFRSYSPPRRTDAMIFAH